MTELTKSLKDLIAQISASKVITDEDVVAMRRQVYADSKVGLQEAENLFALAALSLENRQWTIFFVEAMTEILVNQEKPRGYVSKDNARWMMSLFDKIDRVPTALEMESVVNIVNKAKSCPAFFSAFALQLVKKGVLEGEGALRSGTSLKPGIIGAAEVDFLRMVLYGMGGNGSSAISRDEAEVLFDINELVGEAENHPSWPDLFVKAVANYLMAASGYQAPSRQEALRSEAWRDDDRISIGDFFSNALSSGLRGILQSYDENDAHGERNVRVNKNIAENEVIDAGEAQWLIERINRDGIIHENERKLLQFIRENSPAIHPSLATLLDKVA